MEIKSSKKINNIVLRKGSINKNIYANDKMLKHVDTSNFKSEVLNSQKPILVDFFATWCGPCQMLGPILEKISSSRADFDIAKINIDESQDLALEYEIEVVPTMVIFNQGKPVEIMTGLMNAEEIASRMNKYL